MATKQRLLIFDFRPCYLHRFNNILKYGEKYEKSGLFNVKISSGGANRMQLSPGVNRTPPL